MTSKCHDTREEDDDRTDEQIKADMDNHANQLNPNNDAYWSSRGGSRK